MDSSLAKTVGLAAITAVITVFVARADSGPVTTEDARQAAGTLAADTVAAMPTTADSAVSVHWINDANILALVGTMNDRHRAAAELELSTWHLDTVRALAVMLVRDHADLQHSADSLAASIGVVPQPSALNEHILKTFQAQVDSIAANRGEGLDRAFVRQQATSHALMGSYLAQLGALAKAPALQSWLESARDRVMAEVPKLTAQQAAFAKADSIAADSLARRAMMRRRRQTIPQ